MRVYICTDLEGVCGVFQWGQTREHGTPENVEARHLLMGEVNAAVAGAFDGGATRVVVRDGHNGGMSFCPEELDGRAEMIMGMIPRPDAVWREGFDAAILLGYHAMSHAPAAVLCHTQSSMTWDHYWINGRRAGEIAQSAIGLGACGIPVVMVTGDDKTYAEAHDWLGENVVTVEVKKALSRQGALMLAPRRARALIREGADKAVAASASAKPLQPQFPLTIRWQYNDSQIVDAHKGDGTVVDGHTIERVVNDAAEILVP